MPETVSKEKYYQEHVINAVEFNDDGKISLGILATKILIIHDTCNHNLEVSFNGQDIDGKITWEDEKIEFSGVGIHRIWFKTDNPGARIRLYAWT